MQLTIKTPENEKVTLQTEFLFNHNNGSAYVAYCAETGDRFIIDHDSRNENYVTTPSNWEAIFEMPENHEDLQAILNEGNICLILQ